MKALFVRLSALSLLTLAACGGPQDSGSDLNAGESRNVVPAGTELVLTAAVATPRPGGINPDYFALEIAATVEAGSNECVASLSQVELKQYKKGSRIYVVGLSTLKPSSERIACPMVYAPVYKTVSTVVRASHQNVRDVIVKNVGEMDRNVSAFKL